jgi:hypothetical protein
MNDRTEDEERREGDLHKIAWVAASPSLGYASSTADPDPPELHVLRRTCAEHERYGYRLVSVSAVMGVIDPGLGGTGTVGWYLFFVRDVGAKSVELSDASSVKAAGPPEYLRRKRMARDVDLSERVFANRGQLDPRAAAASEPAAPGESSSA